MLSRSYIVLVENILHLFCIKESIRILAGKFEDTLYRVVILNIFSDEVRNDLALCFVTIW